jgi:calcineurin-like phosphoesterase family protein
MNIFFTADLHLFDIDITKYRGFKSREYVEMITRNWNKVVDPMDHVFILGDISNGNDEVNASAAVQWIQKHLNGYKILIPGNHDTFEMCELFKDDPKCDVKMPGQVIELHNGKNIILTHYPVHSDELKFFDGNIHGHVHSPIPEIDYIPNQWPNVTRNIGSHGGFCYFNANIEFHNWTPVPMRSIEYWYKD